MISKHNGNLHQGKLNGQTTVICSKDARVSYNWDEKSAVTMWRCGKNGKTREKNTMYIHPQNAQDWERYYVKDLNTCN